jgi:hypothetical protein
MPERENLSDDRKKLIHRYMTEAPEPEDPAARKAEEQAPHRLDDDLLRLVEPPKMAPRVAEPKVPRERPPSERKPVEAAGRERAAPEGVEPETSETDLPAPKPGQPPRPRQPPKPRQPRRAPRESEPAPAPAGNEDAVTALQPDGRKATERTSEAVTPNLVESCTIRVWNGYVKSQFFAHSVQREETFAVSPPFRAPGGNIPERTLKAEGALGELVDQLMQLGWYVVADGPHWFDRRLERRLSRSSGNLTAVPPASPPTET